MIDGVDGAMTFEPAEFWAGNNSDTRFSRRVLFWSVGFYLWHRIGMIGRSHSPRSSIYDRRLQALLGGPDWLL